MATKARATQDRDPIGILALFLTLVGTVTLNSPVSAEDQPTHAARAVARQIRREALLPPNGPQGRPLPLASHWNVGTVRNTFEPDHQIGLIQAGHHILPWMSWPSGKIDDERFDLSL